MNKKIIFGLLCLVVLSLSSCASAGKLQAPPMEAEKSAWVVYWDWDKGAGEAQQQKNDALVAFAASFDEQGGLALPAELTAARLAKLSPERSYLSFVNDQKQGSNTVLKDTRLLKKLLAKKASRKHHVADIIALGKENKFSGVEIDYENIWRDAALMKSYAEFVSELRDECRAQDLKLRVVLEPRTLRYAKLLPQDVEYVVMLYNLYGGHSGPGPKADRRFIWRKRFSISVPDSMLFRALLIGKVQRSAALVTLSRSLILLLQRYSLRHGNALSFFRRSPVKAAVFVSVARAFAILVITNDFVALAIHRLQECAFEFIFPAFVCAYYPFYLLVASDFYHRALMA